KKENIVMTMPAESEIIKVAVYYEILSNPVWPMPGISETLLALEQGGFITGIVYNALFYTPLLFEALTGKSLTAHGFKKDLLFFSYECAQAKPSPIMFEKLKDRLYNTYEITADETIYIGNDMLNDVKTASSTGLKTALFAGDRRSLRLREESCTGIVPDAVITSLDQLYKRIL
ncbi:MAG: HAD family hydrolase, partial [Spirochaetes bacterium]